MKDDTIWALLALYQSVSFVGIITEVDYNGNLIKSYSIINDISSDNNKMFQIIPEMLTISDDHSIFVFSETMF